MKKTIIALMALVGVAITNASTLSSYYIDDNETKQVTLDKVVGISEDDATALADSLTADSIVAMTNVTFSLDTSTMLFDGAKLGDTVTLNSLVLASSAITEHYINTAGTGSYDQARDATITLNGVSYTSEKQTTSGVTGSLYGTLTYNFANSFTFTVGDTLAIELPSVSGSYHSQFGVFQGQIGSGDISCTSYETAPGSGSWQPAVKLNVQVVPEPATATLSLLAFAGLAARRRRK